MKRKTRTSILIGIPIYEPDPRFIESLSRFLKECENHYWLEAIQISNHTLVDAQNMIADYFLNKTRHQYLLMLEDDHWGHTRNMLKALLRADADICGMKYYSRHFPYYTTVMKKQDSKLNPHGFEHMELFISLNYTSGYHDVDLVGYGMTLYKRHIFDKLDQPYFRLNENAGKDNIATDINFCRRLREAKLRIVGCFDYTLPHRDIVGPVSLDTLKHDFLSRNMKSMEERYLDKVKEKNNGTISSSRDS